MSEDKKENKNAATNYGTFPANTKKAKSEAEKAINETVHEGDEVKKVVEKVISGGATVRKKGVGSRIVSTFFTGDDAQSVVNYLIVDVLVPAAKNTLMDLVMGGLERRMWGSTGRARTQSYGSRNQGTNYNKMSSGSGSSSSSSREAPRLSNQARANHDFRDILLNTREEAEAVLDNLTSLVEQYESATVSDLYSLVGITGSFQDDKWGWFNLRDARYRRVRDGYVLELPRPEYME